MARTLYKWFNINRIEPGKRVNGKSGKAETTIFWPHYSGKCRTVGTYSPRRNHGRVTASRKTEKTVDTRRWRVDWMCEYIQLQEISQDRAQWRRKISEWSSAVANPHWGRSTSEWLLLVTDRLKIVRIRARNVHRVHGHMHLDDDASLASLAPGKRRCRVLDVPGRCPVGT